MYLIRCGNCEHEHYADSKECRICKTDFVVVLDVYPNMTLEKVKRWLEEDFRPPNLVEYEKDGDSAQQAIIDMNYLRSTIAEDKRG